MFLTIVINGRHLVFSAGAGANELPIVNKLADVPRERETLLAALIIAEYPFAIDRLRARFIRVAGGFSRQLSDKLNAVRRSIARSRASVQ